MKKIKKFRDYDDYEDMYEDRADKRQRMNEKRMQAALKARDYERLIAIEDDFI